MGSFLLLPYETVPQERSEEQWLQLRVRIFEFLKYIKRDYATQNTIQSPVQVKIVLIFDASGEQIYETMH